MPWQRGGQGQPLSFSGAAKRPRPFPYGPGVGVSLGSVRVDPERRDPRPRNPGNDRHDRTIVRDFSQLPGEERMPLIKRRRGINGGGYDAALVKLRRLLETASP